MNRYLLFAGADFYPSGGWHGFRGSFDFEKEAREWMVKHPERDADSTWWHIVDTDAGCIITAGGGTGEKTEQPEDDG